MDTSLQNTLKQYGKAKVKQAVANVVNPPIQAGRNIATNVVRNIQQDITRTLQPGKSAGTAGLGASAGAVGRGISAGTAGIQSATQAQSSTQAAGATAGTAGAAVGGVAGGGKAAETKKGKSAEEKYQDQLRKEIQNAYQQQIDFLAGQEQQLQQQLPGQLEQLGAQYEALRPELQAQLTAQQEAGAVAQEQARMAEQANLAATRRTAEEQGLRAVQQFGGVGGSSAAQAAGELIAREQLRVQGAARNQAAQNIQNVQQQLRAIQAEYDSNVNKLNLEKERALQTARNEFNNQLNAIRQSRMQAGVTKANQTITALQDFATRRRTIEDQSTALANNLTLLKQQAEAQANLLRLQSSLQAPETTPVSFSTLFAGTGGGQLNQSNEAAKLLQSIITTGRTREAGLVDLGIDPNTGERLFQTSDGFIIDTRGNKRSGISQFEQQNPSWWSSLFQ